MIFELLFLTDSLSIRVRFTVGYTPARKVCSCHTFSDRDSHPLSSTDTTLYKCSLCEFLKRNSRDHSLTQKVYCHSRQSFGRIAGTLKSIHAVFL